MDRPKPFDIPKALVWEAYLQVKANKGGAGVDRESLIEFDKKLKPNLYKIWNRTVSDRIAQMTIKLMFEPQVEPHFLDDSYGYRPNKSALDAIGVTRKRCWNYDWLIEFDIRGLFDNIDHELLMKAVRHHTDSKCILLYIERWIKAPLQLPDGTIKDRNTGTPQGGVISPLLANIYLNLLDKVIVNKIKGYEIFRKLKISIVIIVNK